VAVTRPRVLVLRALGIGDLLTSVPALRGIRHALPDHELVLAAPQWLRPLVDLIGAVDRLLPTAELAPVPWSGPPPDVAVDLHGCGPESHRLLDALRPGRLVGFACPGAGVAGPAYDAEEHEVRRWARLVEEAFAIPVDPDHLDISVPPTRPLTTDAVVLHVGAASRARRWPAGRFAELARWCAPRGVPVAVTGSGEDVEAAELVVHRAGLPRTSLLAGRTRLEELAAVVARSALVVAGDTGVSHLATAYRRPSVTLFGPVSPKRWGPPDDPRHAVVARRAGSGDPHGDELDPALSRITVDDVLVPMTRLLPRPWRSEEVDRPLPEPVPERFGRRDARWHSRTR
jgi:ADP-heptose:LPS heptosyltransferase